MDQLCLLVLVACANSYVAAQEVSSQAYSDHEIIPDVLSVPPARYLTVQYPSGVVVEEGNVLTPTEVKDIPSVLWDASPDQFYTIAFVARISDGPKPDKYEGKIGVNVVLVHTELTRFYDPDSPSREDPTSRNVLHWMVGNVPGTDIASGENIAEYFGSGPPQDSGLHRYVFLVYQQPSILEFDEPRLTNRSAENRVLFSAGNFSEKYNMGGPIAGNFFQAEWDEYVPILYEQLGL